jgi:hypothetical protein
MRHHREVEMRNETIIAAVERRLAIAEVREILVVVDALVASMHLHLQRLRTSLGLPSYSWSKPTPLGVGVGFRRTPVGVVGDMPTGPVFGRNCPAMACVLA